MLLSIKRVRGRSSWALASALASLLLLLLSAGPSSAVTTVASIEFCNARLAHNYLAPIEHLPVLRAPGPGGRLGFGPRNVLLSQHSSLVVGGGDIGFKLILDSEGHQSNVDWEVTSAAAMVNARGNVIRRMGHSVTQVHSLPRDDDAFLEYPVTSRPALYRVVVSIRNEGGRKLGQFGAHFRVVPSVERLRLGLNATSFQPGERLYIRLENLGTTFAIATENFKIERYDGAGAVWREAPETPKTPGVAYAVGAGEISPCSSFYIPPGMAPGHYRIVELVGGESVTPLSAEFDVLP